MLLFLACADLPQKTPVPSRQDSETAALTPLPTIPSDWPVILITEAMSDNHGTLEDSAGDTVDWLELYNPGTETVDLAGWSLTDTDHDWQFPEARPETRLLPGEYRLVYASGKGDTGPSDALHTSFSLSSSGDNLRLLAPDGSEIAALNLPALPQDVSYGLAQSVQSLTPIGDGSPGLYSATPPADWALPSFNDQDWAPITLPVGFDGDVGDGPLEDAAFNKSVSQSSDGYGLTGLGAVDGDSATFSHTADGDLASWLAVDLGENYAISSITLINRIDCCAERLYNITLTLSNSLGAVVWTSELINPTSPQQSPVSPGATLEIPVPAGTIASRIQVSKAGYSGSEWLSLGELVVNGVQSGPYSDRIASDLGGGLAQAHLRLPFTVDSPPSRGTLWVDYDDGFSAFLDGQPIAEVLATAPHTAGSPESFVVDAHTLGTSGPQSPALLALQVDNVDAQDDDLFLGARLQLDWIQTGDARYMTLPTPGQPNDGGVLGFVATPLMRPPRGFYETPQTVAISCATPGATLVYTTDGSLPTLDHGTQVIPVSNTDTAIATVQVNSTAFLRAAAFLTDWGDSAVETDTYLFLQDVIEQPAQPAGFPDIWHSISEGDYYADYEMDPEIVDDPAYHDDLLSGLREIPSLSIVMPPEDLFEDNGLYSNSASRGDAWERRASVEWILPDGSTAFQHDVSLLVHGYGWRYMSSTLKHSLRMEFKAEYGTSKLDYPLFADAPVQKFDSIVLRAGGSKTFLDFRNPEMAQYLHDAFARDTARDMGKIDGHATYVHLYLNGLYWGLYMPVERPESGFAEEYFGGEDTDYDVINRRTTTNEAISGDLEAWNAALALADQDLSVQANYDALVANLDIEALIDYMLIHQYMTNQDGPCCASSNNMRGIRFRADNQPWRFFVWDMEYSLWYATDNYNVDIDVPGSISHIYSRLREVPAFRAAFAARAHLHLGPGGALSPDAAAARYDARAQEIQNAIVAESARWGDTYRSLPYSRDGEWEAERERLMNDYFPYRTDVLIAQLTAAGLY